MKRQPVDLQDKQVTMRSAGGFIYGQAAEAVKNLLIFKQMGTALAGKEC
jgi:hypothetical protein